MKKLLVIMLITLLFSACEKPVAPTPVNENATKIELSQPGEKFDEMSNYEGCTYDFDADGNDEHILLMTDAKKDKDGEYMWDDSHHWILAVETEDGIYNLYDNYLHGMLSLNVGEVYDENDTPYPIIRLAISSSSGFSINEYKYTENSFMMETVYDTGYINELSIEKF